MAEQDNAAGSGTKRGAGGQPQQYDLSDGKYSGSAGAGNSGGGASSTGTSNAKETETRLNALVSALKGVAAEKQTQVQKEYTASVNRNRGICK